MYWLLISFLFAVSVSNAQDTLRLRVGQGSTLEIHGQTNINEFVCSQRYSLSAPKEILVHYKNKQMILSGAALTVPVREFDCGHKIMTKDFRAILQTDKYPHLYITVEAILPGKDASSHMARVRIEIAGAAETYTIPLQVEKIPGGVIGTGVREVQFQEFDLEPPVKFMGMVKVKDELKISFNIRIEKVE